MLLKLINPPQILPIKIDFLMNDLDVSRLTTTKYLDELADLEIVNKSSTVAKFATVQNNNKVVYLYLLLFLHNSKKNMSTEKEVESFLKEFKEKMRVWDVLFRDERGKNAQTLVD